MSRDEILKRIEKGTIKPKPDCEIWDKGVTGLGYGQIHVGGQNYAVHRLKYELIKGPIPDGMNVCHTCDVPRCVNTDHLFLGTDKENAEDRVRKRRGPTKSRKLTDAQVRDARWSHERGESKASIARRMKVSYSVIDLLLRGRTYFDVV